MVGSATDCTTGILVRAYRTLSRNRNTDDDRCNPTPRGSGSAPQTMLEPVEGLDVNIIDFPFALTSEATHKLESTRAKGERIHLHAHRHMLMPVETSDVSVGRGNAFASLCLRRGPAMLASFAGRLVVGGRKVLHSRRRQGRRRGPTGCQRLSTTPAAPSRAGRSATTILYLSTPRAL